MFHIHWWPKIQTSIQWEQICTPAGLFFMQSNEKNSPMSLRATLTEIFDHSSFSQLDSELMVGQFVCSQIFKFWLAKRKVVKNSLNLTLWTPGNFFIRVCDYFEKVYFQL